MKSIVAGWRTIIGHFDRIVSLGMFERVWPKNYRTYMQMVDRCLSTDGLGFEIFNVSNDDHSVAATTQALIADFYDGVAVGEMGETETFYANAKAKKLVGFAPQHSWRMYLDDPNG